jgi:peptidoglycan-N-acetylglucosamine deacetylase
MSGIQHWLYPEGKRKALTLSYDDGTIHDRRLVAIFNQYGLRGTFHLNGGLLGTSPRIAADEVKALFAGHEVSGHSATHPTLTVIPREQIIHEIVEDRRILERLVGYPVRGISYPNGAFDDRVVNLLRELGIVYARTTLLDDKFGLPEDPLRWRPNCHHSRNLMEIAARFKEASSPRPSLLYVWGHSYEFDRQGNWPLMDEFGRLIGNQPDIWYATNIEIIDYLAAVQRLVSTMDGTRLHNPSAAAVWVLAEGRPVQVPAGQTVELAAPRSLSA